MELQESHIDAVPEDFAKRDVRRNTGVPKGEVSGRFWITPCRLLSPDKGIENWYTGDVKVETIRQLQFTLDNGLSLSFDFVYRHFDEENGDHVSFPELVANFKDSGGLGTTKSIPEKCLTALDDFLLITSFAARQRCICAGWEASDSNEHVTFYRRGLTIPKPKENDSSNDTLIDISQFEGFLKTAYPLFSKTEPKEFIRQALYAVTAEGRTVETKFIRLFSALETLMLKHRRDTNAEFIFALDEWKTIQEDLQKAIKAQATLARDKTKRCRVYENLSGLNRISFRTAYADFCARHQIKLDDLWPVCGKSDTVPLTEIRNRLVHGEPFGHRQLTILITASHHLEWVLERVLLTMLGWKVEDSRVSGPFLPHMRSYLNWRGASLD